MNFGWPTLPIHDVVLQFTFLVGAALAVQLTLERLHLPGLVGLLLVGILLGPGGVHVLPREPVLELLGSIGLIYIMFLAGLEVDLDVVRDHRREVVAFGALSFASTFLAAAALGVLAGFQTPGVLLFGAALASHTLLSYPMIERVGIAGRRPLVVAVGGTLLTDTLALLCLVFVLSATGVANGVLGGPWISLAFLGLLVVIALRLVPRIADRFFDAEVTAEEKALFVLFLLLAFASMAEGIGTEAILGAFLAGIALNALIRRRSRLHEHIAFVGRMLFIPFFFVDTGMRLELAALLGGWGTWMLAAGALLAVLLGKGAAVAVSAYRFGYGRLDAAAMFGLTTPQAAATLAVTVTAGEAGLLDALVVDAVIIVILLSSLIGSLVVNVAANRLASVEPERSPEG